MLLMGGYRSHFALSHSSFSMDTLCFSQSFTWLHVLFVPPPPPQDAECLAGAVLSGCVAGLCGEEWKCLP